MARAEYLSDFRYTPELDIEDYDPPWHQAWPQIKVLVISGILSAVIAIGYPEFFAEIFTRL